MNACSRLLMRLLILSCVAMTGAAYAAEKWPTRPIRLIVPFGPGGATDIVTRLLQPGMMEFLGQPIVVDNRSGASGNIGAELAARAAPDGYTIIISNVSVASINPTLFASTLKTDLTKELVGVTMLSATPDVLIARADFAPRNVKAGRLKAYAVAAPQRLPQYPGVPTMAEAGYPGVDSVNWNGFFVPRGTPRPIMDRLYAASLRAAQQPQVQAGFEKAAMPISTSKTPEEFQAFVVGELKRWTRIIKENNIKVD